MRNLVALSLLLVLGACGYVKFNRGISQNEAPALSQTGQKPGQATADRIGQAISKNWVANNSDVMGLAITVQVTLAANGDLVGLKIIHSSGDAGFDNTLIRAIRKSVPLPIPMSEMENYREFELTFSKEP